MENSGTQQFHGQFLCQVLCIVIVHHTMLIAVNKMKFNYTVRLNNVN